MKYTALFIYADNEQKRAAVSETELSYLIFALSAAERSRTWAELCSAPKRRNVKAWLDQGSRGVDGEVGVPLHTQLLGKLAERQGETGISASEVGLQSLQFITWTYVIFIPTSVI